MTAASIFIVGETASVTAIVITNVLASVTAIAIAIKSDNDCVSECKREFDTGCDGETASVIASATRNITSNAKSSEMARVLAWQ